ncbi:MAG: peroxiredoxin [Alphaproteobacteria bacterium]|nr:peroxiredoxin [Alphaproteobacteria bacterium]
MTIQIGDRIPSETFKTMTEEGIVDLTREQVFGGKRVVLFGVPGAFTPTCSARHLPGYVDHLREFKDRGVDTVACLAVNDPFVLDAWSHATQAQGILMLADGSAAFTIKLGLDVDASAHAMGIRSKRFAMVVEDGTVSRLFIEPPGAFEVSSAEHVLRHL